MEKTIVSVPGKVILAGEHAVVYGESALVAAVGLRMKVETEWIKEKKIKITDKHNDLSLVKKAIEICLKEGGIDKGVKVEIISEIPVGLGLGSSAALATAIVWCLLKKSSQTVKDGVIKQIEDIQHGNSSGVDQTIVREGGVIKYKKGKGFKKVKISNLENMLLVDSGKPVESTGEMVAIVGENKDKYKDIFKRMGEISDDWRVEKIKENQRLLENIGVVGERAKKMVREIEELGGMAKVCGAGGIKTGSGIMLCFHGDIDKLIQLAKENKWKYYQVELGVKGVKYEKN